MADNVTRGEISLFPSRRRPKFAVRLASAQPDRFLSSPETLSQISSDGDISLMRLYPKEDRITTYSQEMFLEAEIEALNGIKRIESLLEITDEPAFGICGKFPFQGNKLGELTTNEGFYKRLNEKLGKQGYNPQKGKQIINAMLKKNTFYYLNQRLPLCKGFNDQLLTVIVEDNEGKILSGKPVSISRIDRKKVFESEQQMKVALIPLDVEMGYPYSQERQKYVNDTLYDSFFSQGRFDVVERQNLPRDIIEKRFQAESLCEEEKVLQIAERVSAEGIICGKIKKWIDGGVEIKADFRETREGKSCLFHDVFSPKDTVEDLKTIVYGLAMKFNDSFPICEGVIIDIDGDIIRVNIGAKTGVQPCMLYNVFNPADETQLLNKAIIEEVKEDSSNAVIIEDGRSKVIEKRYKVRTR